MIAHFIEACLLHQKQSSFLYDVIDVSRGQTLSVAKVSNAPYSDVLIAVVTTKLQKCICTNCILILRCRASLDRLHWGNAKHLTDC